MSDAIFEITDGTTTISLINKSSGFHMISWTPGITDYKGGGVFTNPPLADWRQLRVGKWDTVQEQFGLTIDAANPNGAAYMLQELRRLLEKANAYWTTDWQSTPVYLVAKAKCETETRYCLVVKGRLANDQNYYQQPFTGKRSTMQDLPLIIERRAWLENAPNSSTAVPISNEIDYNSVTYGRAATTANEVFHANKRTVANITNIHITTAGANLQNSALPYTIIDVSGTNSTYFGIDTSVSNSGPFDNLIFDIGTVQVGATIAWEYWNGSSWSLLTITDLTDQFLETGVNSATWRQPNDWVAASPGGALPVGYYVRARVTATGSINATQQNRNIYSQTVPYVEIAAGQVPGDIPALARITIQNMAELVRTWSGAILGLRSNSRGIASFSPYINFSDEQNPTGVSVAAQSGSFISGSQYPTGRALELSVGIGSNDVSIGRITINSSASIEYYGIYHAYIRFDAPSNFSLLELNLQAQFSNSGGSISTFFESGFVAINDFVSTFIDLGLFSIVPTINRNNPGELILAVRVNYTATSSTSFVIKDLVLMPVDEWAADLTQPTLGGDIGLDVIDADSIRNQKRTLETLLRDENTENVSALGKSIHNGPVILQTNTQQRLYSFAKSISETIPDRLVSHSEVLKQGQVWRNSRYLSLRGER